MVQQTLYAVQRLYMVQKNLRGTKEFTCKRIYVVKKNLHGSKVLKKTLRGTKALKMYHVKAR